MIHYVIASDLITILEAGATGSFFKQPTLKHYSNRELRHFFKRDQDMLVFNCLEDAERYVKENRYDLEVSDMPQDFGYQEYPIYEVKLSQDTNVESYPIESERNIHSYRKIPGKEAITLLSVKVGRQVYQQDYNFPATTEKRCSIQ